MSHTLNLACGCSVYVACNPHSRVAHTRIIERRGAECRDRRHAVGVRLWLWELLPIPGSGRETANGEPIILGEYDR